MKKIAITALMILMLLGVTAHADTYNNAAFIGQWSARGNTDENSTELYINYCDSDIVQVNFKQITNGVELFDFKEYTAKVDDNNAFIHFDYIDEYGTTKPGYIKLSWFTDNIWVSAYSNDDIKFYDGIMYPTVEHFNPYSNPYSYNVFIRLNGNLQYFDRTPFILNGTTYIPLRGILDAMNLNVYWDDYFTESSHTQLITTSRNDTIIQFERTNTDLGFSPWSLTKWKNNKVDTSLPANAILNISERQPLIVDGVTYVPLRIISEEYGATVSWDNATKTVNITGSIASDTKKPSSEIDKIQSFNLASAYKIAASYAGMFNSDPKPYYTYKSKYYNFIQENKNYKIHYNNDIE